MFVLARVGSACPCNSNVQIELLFGKGASRKANEMMIVIPRLLSSLVRTSFVGCHVYYHCLDICQDSNECRGMCIASHLSPLTVPPPPPSLSRAHQLGGGVHSICPCIILIGVRRG